MARVVIEVEEGNVQMVWTDSEDVDHYVVIDRDVEEEAEDGYIEAFQVDGPVPDEIVEEIEKDLTGIDRHDII